MPSSDEPGHAGPKTEGQPQELAPQAELAGIVRSDDGLDEVVKNMNVQQDPSSNSLHAAAPSPETVGHPYWQLEVQERGHRPELTRRHAGMIRA